MIDSHPVRIGKVTSGAALIGYLVVDTQHWATITGHRFRRKVWEPRRRYRLALQPFGRDDWDEGSLEAGDESELGAGRFLFKGEVLQYEELTGAERDAVFSQWFLDWE